MYSQCSGVVPLYGPARYSRQAFHDVICEYRINVRDFFDSDVQDAQKQVAGEVSMAPGAVSGSCKGVYIHR